MGLQAQVTHCKSDFSQNSIFWFRSPNVNSNLEPVFNNPWSIWVFTFLQENNHRFPWKSSTNSLEKTLMLGKIEGRRKRGQQRWLNGITNSMEMNLNKLQGAKLHLPLQEMVKDKEVWISMRLQRVIRTHLGYWATRESPWKLLRILSYSITCHFRIPAPEDLLPLQSVNSWLRIDSDPWEKTHDFLLGNQCQPPCLILIIDIE